MHANRGETNDTDSEIGEADDTAPGTEGIRSCRACTCEDFIPGQDDPNVCGRFTSFREVFETEVKIGFFPPRNLVRQLKALKKRSNLSSRQLKVVKKKAEEGDKDILVGLKVGEMEDYIDHPENGLTVLRDAENKPYISSEEHEKCDRDIINRYIGEDLPKKISERYWETGRRYLYGREEQNNIVQIPDTRCGHRREEHGRQEAS